jgi:hypothetical protein
MPRHKLNVGTRVMIRGTQKDSDKVREAAIEWLKLVLAVVTMAALVVIYFLLPARGGSGLGLIRNLIPNVIATLLVIPVVYVVLTRTGLSFDDRMKRAVLDGMARLEIGSEVFPDDIGQAAGLISDIVARKSKRKKVTIEILAFTNGTFTAAILREMINSNPSRLRVIVHSIDFSVVDASLLPPHWEAEAMVTERRLKELCANKTELEIWHYPTFPFLVGLAIDGADLFIAFPSWDLRTGVIADQNNEYRHYVKSDSTEHHFKIFANWVNQPRQKLEFRI